MNEKKSDSAFLKPTKMLDYESPKIQALIQERKWNNLDEYGKIQAVYDFVQNGILFGYNRKDTLTAGQVLLDGYGQCNTKAALLMALLRGVGIPCRIHGFEAVKRKSRCEKGAFKGYAIATEDIASLSIDWRGNATYVQSAAVVKDLGIYPAPDDFFAVHPQNWGKLIDWMYRHIGRKIMNGQVRKVRNM